MNHTANQHLEDGTPLFSVEYLADYLGVTTSAINTWLRSHPDFTNNPEYIHIWGTGKRPMKYFKEKGIVTYINLREGFRGNRFQASKDSMLLQNSKEALSNKVFDYSKDPVIAMRMVQIAQEERIAALEQKQYQSEVRQAEAHQALLAFPEASVSTRVRTVRSLIVELVNAYARSREIGHGDIWNRIYKEYSIQSQTNVRLHATKEKIKQLDWIEKSGDINLLYAIAKEILT